MNRQSGVTLLGTLIVGSLLAAALLVGFRTVPAYTEYMAVKKAINAVAGSSDPSTATLSDIRRDFDKRAYIDQVTSVTGANLVITKQAGRIVIETQYERRVPLVANVSLLFEFSASTR